VPRREKGFVKKVTTTCPSCNTSFRVTPQQLAARQGQVRCGHCNTLFNGLETLAMADRATQANPAQVGPAEETPSAIPQPAPQPRVVQRRQVEDRRLPAMDESDAPILYRPDFTPAASPYRTWWIAGASLLALLLLIQAMTYFRGALARDVPSMKPILTGYCAVVGCTIALPRNADAITIESSDLKQFPERQKEILLTALLRNRAGYAQAYPSLELTLTDSADNAVVKKTFHPADYLDDKSAIESGIAPLQEANVRLRLELLDLVAVGYRLFVYYP
jgi:predicted Zn finger-like uncharacterized protein